MLRCCLSVVVLPTAVGEYKGHRGRRFPALDPLPLLILSTDITLAFVLFSDLPPIVEWSALELRVDQPYSTAVLAMHLRVDVACSSPKDPVCILSNAVVIFSFAHLGTKAGNTVQSQAFL
jgi:hypothetical protein